jgi:hypothetical protein
MTAILQYLTSELLILSGQIAQMNMVKNIAPSHIRSAIKEDEELLKLLHTVQIGEGGRPDVVRRVFGRGKKRGPNKPKQVPRYQLPLALGMNIKFETEESK